MVKRKSGFTLVELLVVIGIIAVLISILLPAMKIAKDAANKTRCASDTRQIVAAIRLYAGDNRGWTAPAPNYGHWEQPLGTPLKMYDSHAYWGIAYLRYAGNNRSLWICGSARYMDVDPGYSDNSFETTNLFATYGINCYITEAKLDRFKKASETIVLHDAWEHRLDDNGDFLSYAPDPWSRTNISQYRNVQPLAVGEYYRHRKYCGVAWLDGHVSFLRESLGADVPRKWYTGAP